MKTWSGADLEMRAGDTGCDLFEERLLDPDELRGFNHVQDLLDLPQEHHLNRQRIFFFFFADQDKPLGLSKYFLASAPSPLSACRFLAST